MIVIWRVLFCVDNSASATTTDHHGLRHPRRLLRGRQDNRPGSHGVSSWPARQNAVPVWRLVPQGTRHVLVQPLPFPSVQPLLSSASALQVAVPCSALGPPWLRRGAATLRSRVLPRPGRPSPFSRPSIRRHMAASAADRPQRPRPGIMVLAAPLPRAHTV